MINVADCKMHYKKLSQLNFNGAHLHCDEYILPKHYIDDFKKSYSSVESKMTINQE
jgi:hypothetical protein